MDRTLKVGEPTPMELPTHVWLEEGYGPGNVHIMIGDSKDPSGQSVAMFREGGALVVYEGTLGELGYKLEREES